MSTGFLQYLDEAVRAQAWDEIDRSAQRMGSSGRTVIRLTTQVITRRWMTRPEMSRLANWLRRVIRDREDRGRIGAEVKVFVSVFQNIEFSYDCPAAI